MHLCSFDESSFEEITHTLIMEKVNQLRNRNHSFKSLNMKYLLSIPTIALFAILMCHDVMAQKNTESGRYVMEVDQLLKKVENIKRHLNTGKISIAFPDVCNDIEKHAGARTSHFLKAKKAFQKGDIRKASKELSSAREIIKEDVEQLMGLRNREVTSEILRLEQDLGRQVDSILRML